MRKGGSEKEFCEQATRLVTDYLSGDLDRRTVEMFEAHLRRCSDCVSFLETYKEAIRAGKSLECEDIPISMQSRLREFFRERTGRGRSKT
jgi:anti-sigma factor RsiW